MLKNHSKSFIPKMEFVQEFGPNDTFLVIGQTYILFYFKFGEALLTLDFVAFFS